MLTATSATSASRLTFNSFTGFHQLILEYLGRGLHGRPFNSFTGFHENEIEDFVEHQHLSIPSPDSTFGSLPECSESTQEPFNSFTGFHRERRGALHVSRFLPTFNSFTGFHEPRRARDISPLEISFQFLHRIPLMVMSSTVLIEQQLDFQFLHRIPLRLVTDKKLLRPTGFQFLHRIPHST